MKVVVATSCRIYAIRDSLISQSSCNIMPVFQIVFPKILHRYRIDCTCEIFSHKDASSRYIKSCYRLKPYSRLNLKNLQGNESK